METLDIAHLRQWIGRTEQATDLVTPQLVKALRATLFMEPGEPASGDAAPLTAHWCLAQSVAPMDALGPDGHPARGGFLPPVPLPRRMWAGGRLEFAAPLRVGDVVTRLSQIADVTEKQGQSGRLCFVTLDHTISTARGVAIRERQDLVYRDPPATNAATAPATAPPNLAQHSRRHMADPVLLFRYSALTFNGHRIHYDRDYATGVEGYPGLVFHGPLQAALLAEFTAQLRDGVPPHSFDYRGVRPLFDGAAFSLNANDGADGAQLWTANADGAATMTARAIW